jgi:Na+:H+ antiporter, NhaA family
MAAKKNKSKQQALSVENTKALKVRAYDRLIEFFKLESFGGILLVAAAIVALIVANSAANTWYEAALNFSVKVGVADFAVKKPLVLWINDGLMAIFFLLVGLELKREFVEGQFADRKQVLLPALCALGGMVAPMAIYAVFNFNNPVALKGVAIPAATDIAFALGILSLLGSRVPVSLKLLLTAIAVADDLGAIIIIALFYTAELSLLSLALAFVCIGALLLMNKNGVMRLSAYLAVGILMWFAVLKSGVHATLAGVILGLCIPLKIGAKNKNISATNALNATRPSGQLEHFLHPWVAYFILPLFAFANAGVALDGVQLKNLSDAVPLGIVLGLVIGKQIGVFGTAYVLLKLKLVRMPDGLNYIRLWGLSMLCGIGFTMSLFIGSLAFEEQGELLQASYRLGILLASVIAASIAFVFLRWQLQKPV